jgi:hypothetical protein
MKREERKQRIVNCKKSRKIRDKGKMKKVKVKPKKVKVIKVSKG